MKQVRIKYNPYLVETEILIDGQAPKSNSALKIEKKRLQEWVENLPDILVNELRDTNYQITFIGTESDYEDLKSAVETDKISAKIDFKKTADIEDVETEIGKIFNDIQAGPIDALKDKSIVDAFEKAKNSHFEVNVVATMSSGKSTLINALMGQQLMPAANEATTATIVKIIDTDQENFSAVAYDASGNVVKEIKEVTLNDMKTLNSDAKVSTVEIYGKIPFVQSTGMKLVLVDTPGPNNSRDANHQKMTYQMLENSDKSLVLYVMNAQQLGINDESAFLDFICDNMKQGGKQSRERFIFAVNKMDCFSVKGDGEGCIEKALNGIKGSLEARGIMNPNEFPVTACAALELRTDEEEPMALDQFRRSSKKYDEFKFDNYYNFSHLPNVVHKRLDSVLGSADEDGQLEIHTGIVSIEQAISQYVNKYARTTKVADLVASFNGKLNELNAVALAEKEVRENKEKRAQILLQIAEFKKKIETARQTQNFEKELDKKNFTEEAEKEINKYIDTVRNKINVLSSGKSSKVEKSVAKRECSKLEKDCKDINSQLVVRVNSILQTSYKDTVTKVMNEYKKYLSELNISGGSFSLNSLSLVSGSLSDMSRILNNNTKTVDESYYVDKQVSYQQRVDDTAWYKPWTWFGISDHHYETRYKTVQEKVEQYTDYVDMGSVALLYLQPMQKELQTIESSAIDFVKKETERLKQDIKDLIKKVDKELENKLNQLAGAENDEKHAQAIIQKKESDLKWLNQIIERVNSIVKF